MDFQEYFQSYDNYFWEWENEILSADSVFEAIVIPKGSTIAYERFVMETLQLLSLDGFPPFGSLLLTLIATNSNGKESLVKVFEILDNSNSVKREQEYPKGFTYANKFLNTLAELPPEFKEGEKRKLLLQVIFKNCHNRLADAKAKSLMQHYKDHKHLLVTCANKLPLSEANLKKDVHTLAHLNIKYPTQAALLEAISGLPELPELYKEISEQQAEPASTGNFIDELVNEPKTFPVGSLIHRIWGGLTIPLHHSAPSHQPLGGVSDLTNKGDFDKLLITEFANEDEVFMSRIANNEALYIKREVPPEPDKLKRLLLIDCSLKNWGTPKVLAFATALAIAKHPKTNISCAIYVMGNGYVEASYDNVNDVINGLNNLGSKLDASQELLDILENDDVLHSEVFLITSEQALASASMQRVLNDNYNKIKYIITADIEGALKFYKLQNRSRKLIQDMYLPLDELWSRKRAGKSTTGKSLTFKGDTAPEIDYPLLLPLPKKRMVVFLLQKDEYFILTGSGNLYRIYSKVPNNAQFFRINNGAELLLQNLSVKQNGRYALHLNDNGEYIIAAFYPKEMYVSILNLITRKYYKEKVSLKGNPNEYSIFEDNGLYIFNQTAGECFMLSIVGEELNLINTGKIKSDLTKNFKDAEERIKSFEKGYVAHNLLLNLMPLCITKQSQLQFNKHLLDFNKEHSNYRSIRFKSNRDFAQEVKAIYNKKEQRFVFPDGSSIYRDGQGMLMFKSSDSAIPLIFMTNIFNMELAVATDTCFAGNKNYFSGKMGQSILSIADFHKKYFEPFINTIITYGN